MSFNLLKSQFHNIPENQLMSEFIKNDYDLQNTINQIKIKINSFDIPIQPIFSTNKEYIKHCESGLKIYFIKNICFFNSAFIVANKVNDGLLEMMLINNGMKMDCIIPMELNLNNKTEENKKYGPCISEATIQIEQIVMPIITKQNVNKRIERIFFSHSIILFFLMYEE